MCLIIASPNGTLPSEDLLKVAHWDNNHGWGLMWAENGLVRNVKGFRYDTLLRHVKAREGSPFVVHLRWATSGNIDQANSHPFRVTDDLWLMHNGVFTDVYEYRKDRSDTWHFAQELKGVIARFPELNYRKHNDVLTGFVASRCGEKNKVVMLRGDGGILIANEKAGTWKDSLWLSNTHSNPEERAWLDYYVHNVHPSPAPISAPSLSGEAQVWDDRYNCPTAWDGDVIEFKGTEGCDWCCEEVRTMFGFEGQLLCFECYEFGESERKAEQRKQHTHHHKTLAECFLVDVPF